MLALARRYRPKQFADLLVQDHVAAVLRGAVARGRVGHGYLLTGPRGVGKTTAARILAMALNCPNRRDSGDPCGECESCLRIWNGGTSLDVVEIDAASNRGVDDARELRERAMYAASQAGHHKVYIVDEAHMLTREAWNALLKILEEPPPGVVFVFATTEPQKIAATAAPVLSRLQRFDFRRIGPAAIRARLRQVLDAEGIAADEDALTLIARQADGGMRDALSVLDQCLSFGEGAVTADRVRDVLGLVEDELYAEALGLVADQRPEGVFPLVDRLVDAGADLTEFIGGAGELLRALLMLQLGTRAGGADRGRAPGPRALPGPPGAGGRGADVAPPDRERGPGSPERQPPAGGGDAPAPVGDDGSDGGLAGRAPGAREPRAAGRRAGGAQGPSRTVPAAGGQTSPETRILRDAAPAPAPIAVGRPPAAPTNRQAPTGIAEAWPDIVADVRSRTASWGRRSPVPRRHRSRGPHCRWCSPSRIRCSPSAFRRRRPPSRRSCGATPARRCASG